MNTNTHLHAKFQHPRAKTVAAKGEESFVDESTDCATYMVWLMKQISVPYHYYKVTATCNHFNRKKTLIFKVQSLKINASEKKNKSKQFLPGQ